MNTNIVHVPYIHDFITNFVIDLFLLTLQSNYSNFFILQTSPYHFAK